MPYLGLLPQSSNHCLASTKLENTAAVSTKSLVLSLHCSNKYIHNVLTICIQPKVKVQ